MNKNNRFIISFFVVILSQLVVAEDNVVVTGTRGPAGGGPTASLGGSVYDRTEESAKAAAEAEKESRAKSRQDCLIREAAQIEVDRQTCKLPFDTQYKADLIGCYSSDNVSQCNLIAGARQKEGQNVCDRDANQRLVDLPAAYICQR